jgi:hypothetical protein
MVKRRLPNGIRLTATTFGHVIRLRGYFESFKALTLAYSSRFLVFFVG